LIENIAEGESGSKKAKGLNWEVSVSQNKRYWTIIFFINKEHIASFTWK